jgi:phenylpyruvate tautomerase PptA (4-oxalocrotonate tautomerase family)
MFMSDNPSKTSFEIPCKAFEESGRVPAVQGDVTMPMIDVYAEANTFAPEALSELGKELTHAVLRAEGVAKPGPFHLNNTAFFTHIMQPGTIGTAAGDGARVVRVQIITPPNALTRAGQIQLTREVTDIVAKLSGDPIQAGRTWVLLSEAAEGGWGIAGTAYGKEEFIALASAAKAAVSH